VAERIDRRPLRVMACDVGMRGAGLMRSLCPPRHHFRREPEVRRKMRFHATESMSVSAFRALRRTLRFVT